MQKRWLAVYFIASMLLTFFILTAIGFTHWASQEQAFLAISVAGFFTLAFTLVFSQFWLDVKRAEDAFQKFFLANSKKIVRAQAPVDGPAKLVTRDFHPLNQLEMEQVEDFSRVESSYSSLVARITGRALSSKQRLGVDFVRSDEGLLSRGHFDVESLGKRPFLFSFVLPTHERLIISPGELDELALKLPQKVKGFSLKHYGDVVGVRLAFDERSLSENAEQVYDSLVKVKKLLEN